MASTSDFTIYLDDDLDKNLLIASLRREGWMVVSPRAIGTSGFSDEEHLTYCSQRGYPILTRNARDFRQLHEAWQAQGRKHSGILAVYAERDLSKNMSDYDIVRAIKKFLASGIPIANQFIVLNHWR
ncbi:MAG: hypothetical protein DFNUSKGM_000127 [Candidatus Fervidibacter sacchari]